MHFCHIIGLSKLLTGRENSPKKGVTVWEFGSQNLLPDQIFLPDTIYLTGKNL